MATSSAFSTSNKYIKYQITVTEGAYNIDANTSPVTVSVKFYRTNTGYETYGNGYVYVRLDNGSPSEQYVNSNQRITNNGIVLFSKTFTVAHNDDGSKTLKVSAWIDHDEVTSSEQSFNVTLNVIPRASQPSCITWPEHTQNVGYFGDTISIHMNRKSSSFLHTVFYHWGGSGPIIGENVQNGIEWTIPMHLMNQIPNDTQGSGIIYANTYLNGKKIGQKYCGFTVKVPASVKPTCSIQVLDATDTKDKYGSLVQGLSKLYVKVTAAGAYSSTIKKYAVHANNTTYDLAEITTAELTDIGTTTVTAQVTDSRERTSTTASASFPVLAYVKPAITALSVHRCDEDGTENEHGEYVQVTFSAAITPLNNKNSAEYRLRYKNTSQENYTEVDFTALSGRYQVTDYSYIFAADSDYSYEVEVEAQDDIETTIRTTSASTGFTLMDWNDDGKSLAFGKVSEKSGALENALNLNQIGNTFCFQPSSFNGDEGYTLLAVIKLNTLNVNAPIVFTINRRAALCPMHVYVRFASSSTTTDPELSSITYEGDNYGAFLVKAAASTWKLYVDNTSGWSNPCLQSWYTTDNQHARLSLDFPSEQVYELPQPYYRATPAKLQSLLDYIYPVGSIYFSYSHVSPASLFGGTWVRIENAFLWATSATGTIGQTGGESEHTLTISEIPSHSHPFSSDPKQGGYSLTAGQWGSFKTGSSDIYAQLSTVAVGGGAAHNNMPPYIQVSVWRRTA